MVIEDVRPTVDGGRFAVKRVVGDRLNVQATVFSHGHDRVGAVLRYRGPQRATWYELAMTPGYEDRWTAHFDVDRLGRYCFTVEGWIDEFQTWRDGLRRWHAAGLRREVAAQLLEGARLLREAAARASEKDAAELERRARGLTPRSALSPALAALMARNPNRASATSWGCEQPVLVEPELARFSAWYELFPRSASPEPGRHGTFKDVEARLPYVKRLGFDVLYLPPIHPIGRSHRKGSNNAPVAEQDSPGSPWAIGSELGGHKDVNPELGTPADFRRLVRHARSQEIEIALDLAFQCSPDHPWVKEHPSWFRHRPDGSIQPAENPPKRYLDIYPLDFESKDWRGLWEELRDVTLHWVDQGVRVFRVDNPHTKPFAFWEWLLAEARHHNPAVIFLSEAFTRRPVMYRLAKLGFSESYTYFAWRNSGWELREYLTELTQPPVAEFLRPNLWPNTPDILNWFVQEGGRPGSALRLLLAATLSASYGIYGPPFELLEVAPVTPGSEEYLDSEKYQLRHWDLERPGLQDLVARVNAIRRSHPAFRHNRTLRFCSTDNEMLIAYAKTTPDGADPVLVVVNLDPANVQSGWVQAPVAVPGEYRVEDLLDGARYAWRGEWNYVELHPARAPGHVFRIAAPPP